MLKQLKPFMQQKEKKNRKFVTVKTQGFTKGLG